MVLSCSGRNKDPSLSDCVRWPVLLTDMSLSSDQLATQISVKLKSLTHRYDQNLFHAG